MHVILSASDCPKIDGSCGFATDPSGELTDPLAGCMRSDPVKGMRKGDRSQTDRNEKRGGLKPPNIKVSVMPVFEHRLVGHADAKVQLRFLQITY